MFNFIVNSATEKERMHRRVLIVNSGLEKKKKINKVNLDKYILSTLILAKLEEKSCCTMCSP